MLKESEISMKFHPRAFSAFGEDLVTNDGVALTELVKNSYDAYASCVAIVFGNDLENGQYIEVIDDGLGMTQDIVKNAWAVIATPYKMEHPSVERNGKRRMVSGNKGLGRFSAARLGKKMQIITYNETDVCFAAEVNWEEFIESESIDKCKMFLKDYDKKKLLKKITEKVKTTSKTGTIIKICDLNDDWSNINKINSLKSSLARLVSPFDGVEDFSIILCLGQTGQIIKIEPHSFIKNPVYSICGEVDDLGNIKWTYKYAPKGKIIKQKSDTIEWSTALQGFDRGSTDDILVSDYKEEKYCCGGFSFEIRAWDLDTESVADIHETWGMYLYPPILNNSLSTCDILRKVSMSTDLSKIGEPDEYLLVLTPSCDLVNEGIRNAKVEEVLCAKCFDKEVFSGDVRKAGKIESLLNSGVNKQWVALPAYKNICPSLTVDMKKLEIIPLSKVIMDIKELKENNTYLRICSVDSPFREQIIWNYMQTSCRPGVPDRNVTAWAKDIANIKK